MERDRFGQFRYILWSALAVLLLINCAPAKASAGTSGYNTVRVGYYDFDGYQMVDAEGARSGYGYDFLQEMARYAGWNYEYIGYELGWADVQQMLDDGRIDILTSARKTPEREKKYLFSKQIGTSCGILTVKTGSRRITIKDYPSYNGIRVGMIEGSSINQSFRSFAEEKGFTYDEVDFKNVNDLNRALQEGTQIDAECTTNLRRVSNEWILDEFAPASFYVMLRKEDTALLSEINNAIDMMDQYSPGWRTVLWNEYYTPDSGGEIALSAGEKEYIEKVKDHTFSAIVNPDNSPYSYFADGKAKGIIPALFTEMERRSGLKFNILDTKTREEYTRALQDSSVDVVIDAVFDYDKAEKSGRKLTISFLSTPISQVTATQLSGKPSSIALLERGDNTFGGQISVSPEMKAVYCSSVQECLRAVDKRRADICYAYPYTVQEYLKKGTRSLLSVSLMPRSSVSFALSVSNNNDSRLLTVLNKAAASISSEYTDEVILSTISAIEPDRSPAAFFYQYPFMFVLIILVAAFVMSLLIVLHSRKKNLIIIQEKNSQLAGAAQKAEDADMAKTAFLSNISHDMRTPLNAIIGFSALAEKEPVSPKVTDYLSKINVSGKLLLDLINDTLMISRISSGKLVLNTAPVNLRKMMNEIAIPVRSAAEEKNITFLLQNSIDDITVLADRVNLEKILVNLLSNAVKYTLRGGRVCFTAESDQSGTENLNVVFTVQDNGIGMTPEFQKHMYEPFVQEKRAVNSGEGTGLGLAIVKQLVELMSGKITVESISDSGTIFKVFLQLKKAEDKVSELPDSHTEPVECLKGLKILVCEDNELNREIVSALLAEKNMTVVLALNGKDGADAFRSSAEDEFSAVLMDLRMPVMNGYEATREIRNMKRGDAETVPIIAMTADAFEEDIQKCSEAGMNAHIAKPINPDLLYELLEKAAMERKPPTEHAVQL